MICMQKIEQYMEQHEMLTQGDTLVAGVSGGADSVALLMLLVMLRKEYGLRLSVVHVQHGIRAEAEEDAAFVKQLCADLDVPCHVYHGDVPALARQQGMTEEEAGRQFRHVCFAKQLEQEKTNKLVLAHHIGDCAETVLFHLVRGCGLQGAAGIRPVEELRLPDSVQDGARMVSAKVLRPLLCVTKEELLAFLQEEGIRWVEDRTNRDDRYTRNRIRNRVLPVFETVNDRAQRHIADFAQTMAEYADFFESYVKDYCGENVIFEENVCRTDRRLLLKQPGVLRRAVLYEMLVRTAGRKKDITKEHVEALEELLAGQTGKRIRLPYRLEGVAVYEMLQIATQREETVDDWCETVRLDVLCAKPGQEQVVMLPEGGSLRFCVLDPGTIGADLSEKMKKNYAKYFDCDTIKDTLYVRRVKREDYIITDTEGHRKRMPRYFIDRKIPSGDRWNTVVVAQGEEILWIPGGRRSEEHRVSKDTQYILIITNEGDKR